VWHLTENQVACGSNPGGGGIFSFHPFVYLGDLETVSTRCWPWQTISIQKSLSSPVLHLFCCTAPESQINNKL